MLCTLLACQPQHAAAPAANAVQPHRVEPPAQNPYHSHLRLGNALDAQGNMIEPRHRFAPNDTFFVVLEIDAPAQPDTQSLRIRWSHLDSRQIILEERKPLPVQPPNRTAFQLSKPNAWPLGHYKVEVFLDDALIQTRLFDVQTPSDPNSSPN